MKKLTPGSPDNIHHTISRDPLRRNSAKEHQASLMGITKRKTKTIILSEHFKMQ